MGYHAIVFGLFLCVAFALLLRLYLSLYPTKHIAVARIGILTSLSIVLGIVEALIPDFMVPGVKLGFPNIVILLLLCYGDKKEALLISLIRVLLIGLLRGNLFQMGGLMSLSGAVSSFLIMFIIKTLFKKASPVFVSVLGAIAHSSAQLLVAAFFFGTFGVFYYLPIMGLLSMLTGAISGLIVVLSSRKLKPFLH